MADSNHTAVCLPARKPEKEEGFTKKESELYEVLSQIRGDTLWLLGIRSALQSGKRRVFRKLITELKSQLQDNPEMMKRVVGEKAFGLLK